MVDIHSHTNIGLDYSINYVAIPTPLRQWKGEQALGFDSCGNLVARLAGGAQPMFPRIPFLHFIRGSSWEVALQVESKGVWTNLLFVTGENTTPSDCNLWDHNGSPIGQVAWGASSVAILHNGTEIGRIVFHVIPLKAEVFAGAAKPVCILEQIRKTPWLSSERRIAYWLSVKDQEPGRTLDVRILTVAMLFPWHSDVGGHNEVIWENQERPTMKLTRT